MGAQPIDDEVRAFVAMHEKSLQAYAVLKDETKQLEYLASSRGVSLLEGISSVEAWFLARHILMAAQGKKKALEVESRGYFVLGAAADAAKHHYLRNPADGIEAAAREGVQMLASGLRTKGDPTGLRKTLGLRAQQWVVLVTQRGEARTGSVRQQQLLARKPKSDPARLLPSLGYVVLGPIAAGAFSTILKCRSTAKAREVAIKSFDGATCARDPAVGDARDRELQVLRRLRMAHKARPAGGGVGGAISERSRELGHPHVANLIEEEGDLSSAHLHAVLEFCPGGSLHRHLHKLGGRGMPHSHAAAVTGQLASALAYLHSLGIAHGDVKPGNVLLMRPLAANGSLDGLHIKLCDFGFATICGDAKLRTFCGTPAYLAPEIVTPADASRGYLGRPVDMWAVGCVLYEVLHGRRAFEAQQQFALENRIRLGTHQPVAATVPNAARALLGELICVDSESRRTAQQVIESSWIQEAQVFESPPSTAPAPSAPPTAPMSTPSNDEPVAVLPSSTPVSTEAVELEDMSDAAPTDEKQEEQGQSKQWLGWLLSA